MYLGRVCYEGLSWCMDISHQELDAGMSPLHPFHEPPNDKKAPRYSVGSLSRKGRAFGTCSVLYWKCSCQTFQPLFTQPRLVFGENLQAMNSNAAY